MERINTELIYNASELIDTDTKASKNYHMVNLSSILYGMVNNITLRLTPYSNCPGVTDFCTNYIGEHINVDLIKHNFEWLITAIENAGYGARFFTTPTEVKIQVSLDVKRN
jgi:hypothetical protein